MTDPFNPMSISAAKDTKAERTKRNRSAAQSLAQAGKGGIKRAHPWVRQAAHGAKRKGVKT